MSVPIGITAPFGLTSTAITTADDDAFGAPAADDAAAPWLPVAEGTGNQNAVLSGSSWAAVDQTPLSFLMRPSGLRW